MGYGEFSLCGLPTLRSRKAGQAGPQCPTWQVSDVSAIAGRKRPV